MWLFGDFCSVCGARAHGICRSCVAGLSSGKAPPLLGIARATVLCDYDGVGAKLVQAIKYQNRRQGLSVLVDALGAALLSRSEVGFDLIVAVPAHPRRFRKRGYHVPDLMAERLSKALAVPVQNPLTRVDDGCQLGRGRSERTAVEFRAVSRVPERVLLVDDVVTTGATAVACSVALGLAGARHVEFVALASTPPNYANRALEQTNL